MNQRSRKFAGIWLILTLLIVYPIVATLIYTEFLVKYLGGLPNWGILLYFIITGTGWALPAGVIIKWMAKPDKQPRI